jgi:hypothetical protein
MITMKKIPVLLIAILFIKFSFGQASTIKLNDLSVPTSPAFVLMDKSPASIEKPSNPKALSLSLINVWQNSGALEFTPYWLKDRPAYTFDDNLKKKVPLLQTFAVSAATAKTDSLTNIAIGFRTQVTKLYSAGMIAKIKAAEKSIVDMLSVENPDDIDLDKLAEAKKELNYLQSKTTFNAELAGAYLGQSGPITKLSSTKAGVWMNLRYSPDKFPLDLVFLARYSWATGITSASGTDSAFFDYGVNISHQDKDFDLAVEYVNRRDFAAGSNYDRFALVANYQVKPGIVAVASVGKDFTKVNNIFALLGVKFGISKEFAKLK